MKAKLVNIEFKNQETFCMLLSIRQEYRIFRVTFQHTSCYGNLTNYFASLYPIEHLTRLLSVDSLAMSTKNRGKQVGYMGTKFAQIGAEK